MKTFAGILILSVLISCPAAARPLPPLASDAEIDAAEHAPLPAVAVSSRWNEPFAPFNVIGDIYYVGTDEIASYLITTAKGHILLDGVMAQTAPQIMANIRAMGFDIRDVRYLLNSHAHIDHAGGLAGLQRASGAVMVASAGDRDTLEAGVIDYGPSAGMRFPPIRVDRVIADGETVTLGGVTLVAHMTPGHTRGCTSWSMTVAGADRAPHTAFFHCSSTVAGQSLVPESYPGMVAAYRSTFARVRELDADVFLANHAGFFDLKSKRARQIAGEANAFVKPGELQLFNADMEKAFEAELVRQQSMAK